MVNITFIGIGYVGLVHSVMMSQLGYKVFCIDKDKNKICNLNKGILPIYEPKLKEYTILALKAGKIEFFDYYPNIIKTSRVIFIAVDTPQLKSGEPDLSKVFNVINKLQLFINEQSVIVIKSTVPPGTAKKIMEDFLKNYNLNVNVVSNPEFIREGSAVQDFLNPHRIIVGSHKVEADLTLRKLYKTFIDKGIPFISTNNSTAELIKYASNAFLATKITFINEMANLCESIGCNIDQLSLGLGLDSRIGNEFLKVGPGFGGSCFPKDTLGLLKIARNHSQKCYIVDATIKSNNQRIKYLIDKISLILGGNLKGKRFAVLGLTYKADTDDLRNSPAIKLIKALKYKNSQVIAYDLIGMKYISKYIKSLKCASSAEEACKNADAIIIATEWLEFKGLNFKTLIKILKSPTIIDLRNILDAKQVVSLGYNYYPIGYKL